MNSFPATTNGVTRYLKKKSRINCDSFSNYNPVGTCHFIWHILKILSYYNSYCIKFRVDTMTQTLHSSLTHFIRKTGLQSGSNTTDQYRVTALTFDVVLVTQHAFSISILFDFSASKCKMKGEVVNLYINFLNKSETSNRSPDISLFL